MSMIDVFRSLGRADAKSLRNEAASLTGTQIIDREVSVPMWRADGDYTGWPAGAPVQDMGQVWILLQPHNAAHYAQRPVELRALWGLAHTTNPKRAKPWVEPFGTSGMYMTGECYRKPDGSVKRATKDNLVWDADAYPEGWEDVPDA